MKFHLRVMKPQCLTRFFEMSHAICNLLSFVHTFLEFMSFHSSHKDRKGESGSVVPRPVAGLFS